MEEYGLYNLEAEQALVGAMFLEEGLIQECTIQPDQLYSRKLKDAACGDEGPG